MRSENTNSDSEYQQKLKARYLLKLKEFISQSWGWADQENFLNLERKLIDWESAIDFKIPFDRLQEAFDKAYLLRTDSLTRYKKPLHPHDMTYAWLLLKRKEDGEKEVCKFESQHLPVMDVPTMKIASIDFSKDVLVPCPGCQRKEFKEFREKEEIEFRKEFPDATPFDASELIEDCLERLKSNWYQTETSDTTAESLLGDAYLKAQKLMMSSTGQDFKNWRSVWKKLFNARKYLRNPNAYQKRKKDFKRQKQLEINLKKGNLKQAA